MEIKVKNYDGDSYVVINDNIIEGFDCTAAGYDFITCDFKEIPNEVITWFDERVVLEGDLPPGLAGYFFHQINIASKDGKVHVNYLCDRSLTYSDSCYEFDKTFEIFIQKITEIPDIFLFDFDDKVDTKGLTVGTIVDKNTNLIDHIMKYSRIIVDCIRASEKMIELFEWKNIFMTDEARFRDEVIHPLLLRMQFRNVVNNHGTKEYGKDFVFSEITPFNNLRHYGLQAKSGNISGKVGSEVDYIVAQLGDAFSMPFYELGSDNESFISTFVLATSGYYTDNAKAKIARKISKGIYGSVYFLDRDKLFELIHKYWTSFRTCA